MNTEEQKKRWIKYIQTARKTLSLPDDVYITILYNAAGVDSSTQITTEKQFLQVRKALQNAGFGQNTNRPLGVSLFCQAVYHRAQSVLGADHQIRLNGFLHSTGLPTLNSCTDKQLRMVMAFLSRIEKSCKNG